MRIVTWNLNNRRDNQAAWRALFALEPDIALLCEVNSRPNDLVGYEDVFESVTAPDYKPRKFSTGMIVRGRIGERLDLPAAQPWVNDALAAFPGNIVGRRVVLPGALNLSVFSIHMPHKEIPVEDFTDGDVSDVRLPNYTSLHLSELLWAALSHCLHALGPHVVLGGDYNTSEFIGSAERQHEANREVIRRMARIGLTEAVRDFNNGPVSTHFKRRKEKEYGHQLDHLYLSDALHERLASARVGDRSVYGEHSDHLPIIVDMKA